MQKLFYILLIAATLFASNASANDFDSKLKCEEIASNYFYKEINYANLEGYIYESHFDPKEQICWLYTHETLKGIEYQQVINLLNHLRYAYVTKHSDTRYTGWVSVEVVKLSSSEKISRSAEHWFSSSYNDHRTEDALKFIDNVRSFN